MALRTSAGSPLLRVHPQKRLSAQLRWLVGLRPKFRNILGVACTGHGASLALVTRDGVVRSSVLERWSGIKYALLFSRAEDYDLRNPNSDIDGMVHYMLTAGRGGKFPPTLIFEDTIREWTEWFLRGLNLTAADIDLVVTSESHFATCYVRLGQRLNEWFPKAWHSNAVEHHEIHQRQAFWQSGYDEAAVLTLDGCGESLERLGNRYLSGTISVMDASGRCETLQNLFFPESSAGLLYDVFNRHCGFKLGDEGKTMGLAPYGGPELLRELEPRLQLHDDGTFSFIPQRELEDLLFAYQPFRVEGEEITERHKNVAYAGQALLEKIVVNAFKAAAARTGQRRLAYAGGVALNSVANEIALRAAGFDELYVTPNPGDAGHALGAALFAAYEIARWRPALKELPDYLGPEYTDAEMIEAARASGFHVTETADMAEDLAQCIENGYIIARFGGRAEHGPRALGNRSILCDPRRAEMKDYLNDRVKHRESFRPFAPAVLEEEASRWFDIEGRSAFMLRVVAVRPEVRDRVAATVHVDGSCRVQTVSAADNQGFYDIIRAFYRRTGVPVVLNTSFNIAGKPIVETPRDAVECFVGTEIDVLSLGPVIVSKRPFAEYRNSITHADIARY